MITEARVAFPVKGFTKHFTKLLISEIWMVSLSQYSTRLLEIQITHGNIL